MNTFNVDEKVDFSNTAFPCSAGLYGPKSGTNKEKVVLLSGDHDTFYGFCTGPTILFRNGQRFRLPAGMFFQCPNRVTFKGSVLVIQRYGYTGMFGIGGGVEATGRLKYIDGCTDTMLIPPLKLGDPCLNHLHFPKGISQTMHTHPSVRIGVVWKGSGVCHTPDGDHELQPGNGWFLPEGGQHCFETTDSSMDVIAWHPETDTGPCDEDHPMLNRTYVNGTSARHLPEIRTK